MKSTIKERLKGSPPIYSFLRLRKIEAHHISNYLKIITGWLKGAPSRTTKEDLPKGCPAIEITNACNLNCLMCRTKASKRPVGFIEPRILNIILQKLSAIGIKAVSFHTVGEPFMHKGLEELLEIAGGYGFRVWLSTNGQFPQRIESLYKRFPDLANWYRFSIDGATRQSYELIRQGASFDKLLESLEMIHRINDGKRNSRISLSITSMLGMTNIYDIAAFFKVYSKYCYPESMSFFIPYIVPSNADFAKKDFPFPNLIRPGAPCSMPFKSIHFTYSGKATLCCRDYEEELVIGDIEEGAIIELWNGPRAESIRNKHLNPESMDISPCRLCFVPSSPLVSDILNEYIRFLAARSPQLDPRQFGDKVLSLLNKMDFAKGCMNRLRSTRSLKICMI